MSFLSVTLSDTGTRSVPSWLTKSSSRTGAVSLSGDRARLSNGEPGVIEEDLGLE